MQHPLCNFSIVDYVQVYLFKKLHEGISKVKDRIMFAIRMVVVRWRGETNRFEI